MTTEFSSTSVTRANRIKRIQTVVPSNNSRSSSPFNASVNLPSENGSILRTRSLDDQHHTRRKQSLSGVDDERMESICSITSPSVCPDEKDGGNTVATALHSSFDLSLLRADGDETSRRSGDITLFENGLDISECDSEVMMSTRSSSFESLPTSRKKFNPRRSYQQNYSGNRKPASKKEQVSYIDLKPPATVRKSKLSASRKARRQSSDSATTATTATTSFSNASFSFSLSKTPGRTPGRPLLHGNISSINSNERTPRKTTVALHKSPAPSSTAKRRRAPFAHPARLSPMRRVTTSSSSHTPTSCIAPPPFGAPLKLTENEANNKSFSTIETPTHQNLSLNSDSHGSLLKKLPYHIGSTPGRKPLETTSEADENSVDTNSPARFRFTSFPASLPRVHHTNHNNLRSTPPVCPGSVRKRMSFDTEEDTVIAEHHSRKPGYRNENGGSNDDPLGLNYSVHQQDTINQSRDDDGTHNTSVSSLSIEGGHHQHLPHLPLQHPPHFGSAPTKNLLLFPGEPDDDNCPTNEYSNNLFGYSDDEDDDDEIDPDGNICAGERFTTVDSPEQDGIVRRTRLNFNVFLSPPSKRKGVLPAEKNSKDEDGAMEHRRIDIFSNVVDLSRPYDAQNRINSFPSSLSSNTLVNASTHTNEDNLIRGPESSSASISPPRASVSKGADHGINLPKTPREVHLHFPLESECSPILGACTSAAMLDRQNQIERRSILSKTQASSPSRSTSGHVDEGTTASILSSSSSMESTTTSQKRRLRPMPDMSAFENVKNSSSSSKENSADTKLAGRSDVLTRGLRSRRVERVCPPTPQRTPAWANEGGGHPFFPIRKQSSLIATKVLLSCPSQVLEGRTSLETSVLDEDNSSSRRNSFSNSIDSIESDSHGEPSKSQSMHEDEMEIENCDTQKGLSDFVENEERKGSQHRIAAPPKLMRRLPSDPDIDEVISFSKDFEILGSLGSGAFADVYKVRQKSDNNLYAVKRNRRQFRGKRDRDVALAEVQSMQRLQSVFGSNEKNGSGKKASSETSCDNSRNCYSLYLLFFYRAWQEEGYFFSQTELCCRDTCRELLDSMRFLWNSAKNKYPSLTENLATSTALEPGSQSDSVGRLIPNMTVWKICHDVCAGLSHIHSHGIVHQDIKPSNIFLVTNARFGAMCKIGDFGLAGSIGSSGDGQEGDTRYMPSELLASGTRQTSGDIFSLGLTLYEIATDERIEMPSEGPRWHRLRSNEEPTLPASRGDKLQCLLRSMTDPVQSKRPTADTILENAYVKIAGNEEDKFLHDYIRDVEEYDRREEERLAMDRTDDQTPRNYHRSTAVRSPSLSMLLPGAPTMFSPSAKFIHQ